MISCSLEKESAAVGDGQRAAIRSSRNRQGFLCLPRLHLLRVPTLANPTGVFSLGFLRVNASQLDLAVLHLPSSFTLWWAALASPVLWSSPVSLSFNSNLVVSNSGTGITLWSTATDGGDRLILLNLSNL